MNPIVVGLVSAGVIAAPWFIYNVASVLKEDLKELHRASCSKLVKF